MTQNPLKSAFNPEIQRIYDGLLDTILCHRDAFNRIRVLLTAYPEKMQAAQSENEFIDTKQAREILVQAQALFAVCEDHPHAPFVPYALAAIDYFICENDATPDFKDPFDGWADDAEVIQQVITRFGLEEKIRSRLGDMT
jgi:uncharacterized membrane protein YkvA (DUF1232 family)